MSAQYDKLNPDGSSQDGCIRSVVVVAIAAAALVLLLAFGSGVAAAESDTWDRSSIVIAGQCLTDGTAEFVVTNTGRDMAGPSAWREYEENVLTADGTFQLAAGASQTWIFASNGVPIRFEADQRPWHPGSSAPRLTLTCDRPTAVTLTAFGATSTQLLSTVCQKGVVTDFLDAPGRGHVVFVVRSGKAFSDSYFTVRHYRKTQRVTVCAGVVS